MLGVPGPGMPVPATNASRPAAGPQGASGIVTLGPLPFGSPASGGGALFPGGGTTVEPGPALAPAAVPGVAAAIPGVPVDPAEPLVAGSTAGAAPPPLTAGLAAAVPLPGAAPVLEPAPAAPPTAARDGPVADAFPVESLPGLANPEFGPLTTGAEGDTSGSDGTSSDAHAHNNVTAHKRPNMLTDVFM